MRLPEGTGSCGGARVSQVNQSSQDKQHKVNRFRTLYRV